MKLLSLFFISFTLYSSELYIKTFPKAKLYRTPHFKSKLAGSIAYGTPLTIIEKEGPLDSNLQGKGQWMMVETSKMKGWVFSLDTTKDSSHVTANGGDILDILGKEYRGLILFENELIFHKKCEKKIPKQKFILEKEILKWKFDDGNSEIEYPILDVEVTKKGYKIKLDTPKGDSTLKLERSTKILNGYDVFFQGEFYQFVPEENQFKYKTREENCDK
ncbi:MAG: hypothetical protein SFU98_20940 [Leptospiraceae bacterium]|nr:hypothetical protein [Leptospiraceae bacterium]